MPVALARPCSACFALQPDLVLEDDPAGAPLRHLVARHLDRSPAALCGPPHKAAHPNRCFFIDSTLWTTPALAPTALVPTLPEMASGECGFKQLELGDEEQLARYPVLQAIRSGISLDAEAYTRGSYHTLPVVPGAACGSSCYYRVLCACACVAVDSSPHCGDSSLSGWPETWTVVHHLRSAMELTSAARPHRRHGDQPQRHQRGSARPLAPVARSVPQPRHPLGAN
jgi:hypothetical protein